MEKQITWSAPEFHYYEKGPMLYWALFGISSLLAILALFQQNFFFAVFIVIAAVLSGIWGARTPRTLHFALTERGLDIQERKLYPYDVFVGFSIVSPIPQSDSLSEIVFLGKGITGFKMRVIADKNVIPEIREELLKKIPELEYEESVAEHIGRILRF